MTNVTTTDIAIQEIDHTEFGKLRCVVIDGVEWFDPAMPCDYLGLVNRTATLSRLHNDDTLYVNRDVFVTGNFLRPPYDDGQYMTVINESGLYTLILRSNKPKAVEMQRWVTHEVLPAIRKTGRYVTPGTYSGPELTGDLLRQMADHMDRLALAEPKAIRHDRVMEVDGGWGIGTVGRLFGFTPHPFYDVMRLIKATYKNKHGQNLASDFWIERGWMISRGHTPIVTPAGIAELERLFERSADEYVPPPADTRDFVSVRTGKRGPKRKIEVK